MLRPYQQRLVDETIDYLKSKGHSPLVVAPTGSGKTHVIAHLVKRFRELVPDARVLLLSHRKELLEQNLRTLQAVSPSDSWGVCCAGLSRSDTSDDLLIASVQSVYRKASEVAPRHLVLIDEAHLLGPHEDSMYGQLLKILREALPRLRLVGLTATPFRLLGGSLLNTGVFDGISSEARVRDLIDQGFLAPLVSRGSRNVRLDTRSLKKRGGDFLESEMERLYDQQSVTEGAIDEMLSEGADRHHWLVFCCSVAHAEHVTERLNARGVPAACVHSGTLPLLRAQHLEDFRSGRLRCLVNMEVLTTGFDAPNVDLVACLRPTASLGLWIQVVGRGLRIAPGKRDCKILDFAGNCERLGAIDNVTYHRKRTYDADNMRIVETLEPKAAPITVCPSCVGIFEGRLVVCPVCREEIRTNLKHSKVASEASVLTDTTPRELAVLEVRYLEHHKRGAPEGTPPTFRVSYVTQRMPLEQVSEYLGFESPKRFAHMIAARWWQEHGGQEPVPRTVAEALGRTGELATVSKVTVRKEANDGRYYDRVISWRRFELPTAEDLINIF